MSSPDTVYIPSSVKGENLHTLIWNVDAPRAVVQISHGMAEHIARYDEFARYLNDHGIAVIGASHLGHGQTAADEKKLGYFASRGGWRHVVDDLHIVRQYAEKRWPGVPYVLLGHSMGSFLARTYISLDYADGLSGAVISGTANQGAGLLGAASFIDGVCTLFQGRRHRSKLLDSLSFGSYNMQFAPNRTAFDWLSKNNESVDAYIADPYCGFCFTLSAFRDLFSGLKFIGKKKNIRRVRKDLPVMFIAGELDPVGENGKGPSQVAEMFRKAGVADVTLRLYPGDRHEVLNELDRGTVYADVLAFIERVAPEKTAQ